MGELPAGYRAVTGTRRSPVPGAVRIGDADRQELVLVSIRLRRRPSAPALPELGSGVRLNRGGFAAVYGADPADIAQVENFAARFGLGVRETSVARRTVVLAGIVEQLERAFAVELGDYQIGQMRYRGREGHVHLPAELAAVVEGVFGLDNRPQARPQFRSAAPHVRALAPNSTQALTPPQVAGLYEFPAGLRADGQCIGLLEFGGGYAPADIAAWFSGLGLVPPGLADVSVLGAANSPGSDADVEVVLDIDVAASVAPGARVAVYFAPWTEQGWVDAVTTAVHDAANEPSVLSISWGWPEFETAEGLTWTAAAMDAVSVTFQEAGVLGMTVLAASGDQGTDCQIGDGVAHVIYPGCDPYVTSCGGTEIKDVSAAGFTEVLWQGNGASGGGVSVNFAVPDWQTTVALPASVNDGHAGRGIPDIAGNAHPDSGYVLILDGADIGPVGGTSAVAPLYAGLIALASAQAGAIGFINPTLYQLAGSDVFRDITCCGDNGYGGAPGYPVGAGWDTTTGFGSVRGAALVDELSGDSVAALIPSWH
jgi:kumamolisin